MLEDGTLLEAVVVRVLLGIEESALFSTSTYGDHEVEVNLERTPLFDKALPITVLPRK